jgi:phage/plasmid-like protein (TIGR03299 family)
MAHNLNTKKDGTAAVFYTGGSAWHRLGTELQEACTAEQAIVHAGLDYEVVKAPLVAETPCMGGFADVPDFMATMRADTNEILGVVGKGYKVIQNREAFSFFDGVVDADEAVYTSGGAIGKGEKIWIQAKMPAHIKVGKNDLTEMFVTLYNTHNGQASLKAYLTPIRIVCENTLRLSLGKGHCNDCVSIRHTPNAANRLSQAAEIMGLSKRYADELSILFNHMAGTNVSKTTVNDFLAWAFPATQEEGMATRTINNREKLLSTMESGVGQKEAKAGTAWWLINGYTRFLEDGGTRDAAKEVDSLLQGTIHRQRQAAFEWVAAKI